MNRYGYGAYRGRSPMKKFLKALLVIFLILVILCAAAAIYLQQFLVFSSDGVRLELPFLSGETSPEPSLDSVLPDDPLPTPTPEPTPTPVTVGQDPVLMPAEALSDGSVQTLLEQAGGDCALFDMKTDDSKLKYVSSIPLIAGTDLNSHDEDLNDTILALNETEDLYTVARVSCFKDGYVFLYNDNFPIRTNSGYRWTGPDTMMWISPTNPDVQDYIVQVCVELAKLGFDEIVLDNAGYPREGNLHYIRLSEDYDPERFSTVIGNFYTKMASALAEYDVKLSAVTTPEAMAGEDALTGQTPENLAPFFRLWMYEDGALKPLEEASPSA